MSNLTKNASPRKLSPGWVLFSAGATLAGAAPWTTGLNVGGKLGFDGMLLVLAGLVYAISRDF